MGQVNSSKHMGTRYPFFSCGTAERGREGPETRHPKANTAGACPSDPRPDDTRVAVLPLASSRSNNFHPRQSYLTSLTTEGL